MLIIFIAYLIDGFGAYFLTKKFNRWIALIPLAVIIGFLSSIASNTLAFFLAQGVDPSISSAFYIFAALKDTIKHIIWCLICMWLIRRKKSKSSENKTDQAN